MCPTNVYELLHIQKKALVAIWHAFGFSECTNGPTAAAMVSLMPFSSRYYYYYMLLRPWLESLPQRFVSVAESDSASNFIGLNVFVLVDLNHPEKILENLKLVCTLKEA